MYSKVAITILLVIAFLIPGLASSGAIICDEGNPEIIKNELPCVETMSECVSIELINNCEEEVYYTNLECWNDGRDEYYAEDGFVIQGNTVTLSDTRYSGPIPSENKKYFGRINYAGGVWLPCRLNDSFYDETNKQITIGLRKGDQDYKIVVNVPSASDNVNKSNITIMVVGAFLVVVIAGIIFYITKKRLKKN